MRTEEQAIVITACLRLCRATDGKLEDYLRRRDQSDVSENPAGGARVKNLIEKIAVIGARRRRCTQMLAELGKTGENQISLTDPDSRAGLR